VRDPDDFDVFYAGTVRRVTSYLYTVTGSRAEAEDAAQEAYARAWQRWDKISGYGYPEGWVRTVGYRIAVNARSPVRRACRPAPSRPGSPVAGDVERRPQPDERADDQADEYADRASGRRPDQLRERTGLADRPGIRCLVRLQRAGGTVEADGRRGRSPVHLPRRDDRLRRGRRCLLPDVRG